MSAMEQNEDDGYETNENGNPATVRAFDRGGV